ncbi:MAG: RdgB/HAM1 family non-canonical purine NTP pyrophosphatase [Archangium sp.]|nr:RdgB/HAM1 family non-canonical purine NTP pyrophosphatase [Archangium sp.]
MSSRRLVFASTNAGKLAELSALLGSEWTVQSLSDFPQIGEIAETADTFEGNALLKARACLAATGILSVADDSGLCVDALGGGPGVHSARYAATDALRISTLLSALHGLTPEQRTARFVCVLCAAWPDGRIEYARGECEGRILHRPRGEGGFGYDPIFRLPEGRSMAELSREEKAAVSHRGKAFAALVTRLTT